MIDVRFIDEKEKTIRIRHTEVNCCNHLGDG